MLAAGAGAGTGAGAPPQQQSAAGSATGQHPAAAPASVGTPSGNGDSFEERIRRRSSPLVRKIAAEHGIEIGAVPGSGIAGRVTKKDILGFMESGGATRPRPPVAGTRQAAHAAGAESPMPEPWAGDLVEPMSKMRALISEHMVVSRRTSAHVTSFFEADFTRIARIRARHRAEF
jgi:2-oxoglutarate dehydrogenase E2 component (dihydrolipoamide succinyltransferase)